MDAEAGAGDDRDTGAVTDPVSGGAGSRVRHQAAHYRVALSAGSALAVVGVCVLALALVNGAARLAMGEIESFRPDGTRVIVVGVLAVLAAAVTAFAIWSGWWRDVWRDSQPVVGARWLVAVPVVIAVPAGIAVVVGVSAAPSLAHVGTAVALTALVGYSEELVFRGCLVRGLATAGMGDVRVLLLSSAVFAFAHAANLALAGPLVVGPQVVAAFVLGAAFYVTLRITSLLVVPVVLHAAVDLGPLLASGSARLAVGGLYTALVLVLVILLPLAARHLRRESSVAMS